MSAARSWAVRCRRAASAALRWRRRRSNISRIFCKAAATSEFSTTMVFVGLLKKLMQHKEIGKWVVPIIPDEARTFGMDAFFKPFGIYSNVGQIYEPAGSSPASSGMPRVRSTSRSTRRRTRISPVHPASRLPRLDRPRRPPGRRSRRDRSLATPESAVRNRNREKPRGATLEGSIENRSVRSRPNPPARPIDRRDEISPARLRDDEPGPD